MRTHHYAASFFDFFVVGEGFPLPPFRLRLLCVFGPSRTPVPTNCVCDQTATPRGFRSLRKPSPVGEGGPRQWWMRCPNCIPRKRRAPHPPHISSAPSPQGKAWVCANTSQRREIFNFVCRGDHWSPAFSEQSPFVFGRPMVAPTVDLCANKPPRREVFAWVCANRPPRREVFAFFASLLQWEKGDHDSGG